MNKSTTLLFALFAVPMTLTSAFGQSRFSIAPTFMPGYRSLNYMIMSSDNRLTGSSSGKTISGGLTAHYALSQHWSVSAGLLYNRFRSDDNSESVSATSVIRTKRPVTYESLQVPLLLNYTVSTRRLSPYLSAGLLAGYDFRDTFTGTINGMPTTFMSHRKLDGPRALIIQPMVGIGINYHFTPGVSLIVQPTAAYELGQPSDYYSLFRNYQLGLQTQLKISF